MGLLPGFWLMVSFSQILLPVPTVQIDAYRFLELFEIVVRLGLLGPLNIGLHGSQGSQDWLHIGRITSRSHQVRCRSGCWSEFVVEGF